MHFLGNWGLVRDVDMESLVVLGIEDGVAISCR